MSTPWGARALAQAVPPSAALDEQLHDPQEYWEENRGVLAWLIMVSFVLLGIFIMDRRWKRRQMHLAKVTGIMNESHAFSLNLVRHFMPSFKVEKYQFRGMQAKAGTADIEFENLSLKLKNGRAVLAGVTGEFKAGRLCAIMGPSGAGKTTFMNVLCGKAHYGTPGGRILVNGVESDISRFKSVTGFVPQDDIVHQDLTVREQIEFSAKLRNSVDTSRSKIQAIAQDVLNVMQIDHIQNSIVGSVEERGISGGQRKRVNVGLELAAQPTVLFLDEPTSGLDSTSSLSVTLSLKKMCQLGMTSIMVIHQPRYSLFTLFDDVLLLGRGGRTVYLGPSLGAKPYFESIGFDMPQHDNPADWFMDVLSGEVESARIANFRPDMLFDLWTARANRDDGFSAVLLWEQGLRAREMNASDDLAILAQKLEEEWDKVDRNGDGVVDAEELRILLSHCSTLAPSPEIVGEIMDRMAGKGAESVTRKEFLEHLCSLSKDIASDPTLNKLDKCGKLGPHQRSVIFEEDDSSELDVSEAASSEGSQGSSDPERGLGFGFRCSNSVALDPLTGLSRDTPGFWHQFQTLLLRRMVQWWRMNPQRALFVVALTLGGVVLGCLDAYILAMPRWSAMSLLNLHTALALLLSIFCLQVFGSDQPVFWREAASGVNVLAYFISRLMVDVFDTLLMTFVFASVYFVVRQPFVPFFGFFIPFLLIAYVASGWGYFVSTVVPPRHGPFIVSLVIFIVCGLLGNPSSLQQFLQGGTMEVLVSSVSITRWSIQMNFYYAYHILSPQPKEMEDQYVLAMQKDVLLLRDWGLGFFWTGALALAIMGTVLRILSYLGLRFMNRAKQV